MEVERTTKLCPSTIILAQRVQGTGYSLCVLRVGPVKNAI